MLLSLFFSLTLANSTPIQCPSFNIPVDIESEAPYVYLVDYETGMVLIERNGERPMHPSSMTKIMTAYLAMKKFKSGQIKPGMIFTVSKTAWRREGSSMFLNIDDQVTFEDLLKGIVIQSGNDASVVLAEGLSGSESAYAAEMTRLAKEMGAQKTTFLNVTGLPHPQHLTTPSDLALISRRLIRDFPQHYKLYSEKNFTYKNIKQGNRNPLLYKKIGCDGVKTGSSSLGGYGMVASCVQNGHRLILIINGLRSMQRRSNEAMKLMTWGRQTFGAHKVFEKGQEIGRVPIYYGEKDFLGITVASSLAPVIPHTLRAHLQVRAFIPKALKAPITKGQELGYIEVGGKGIKTPYKIAVIAAESIEQGHFIKHMRDSLVLLFS